MNRWRVGLLFAATVAFVVGAPTSLLLRPTNSYAIPAFSRQYGTSCTTCHVDFPKLNWPARTFVPVRLLV